MFHSIPSVFSISVATHLLRAEAEAAMEESHTVAMAPPWERECPMTRLLLVDGEVNGKARFHQVDCWHSIHLGVGKSWVACGIMTLQQLILDGTNVDSRIEVIAREYKEFCRRSRLDPIIRKIDVRTFGCTTSPEGTWNKAAITSNFMMFLEDFCERRSDLIEQHERLRLFVSLHNFKKIG